MTVPRSPFVVGPDTRARQRRAADPTASVWVSANAGSGKTKVLTDRVVRLLLAGTSPARILCLTFTKAAAAEMTIRVFEQLGAWVTMPDAKLAEALADLTGAPPSRTLRARARRLFARSVETPGGLKIETIHAFCERVLHLVPFEAGVPARFTVLDDGQSRELAAEARSRVFAEAARGEARLAAALDTVAALESGDRLTALVDAAVADERAPADEDALARAMARLRRAFGLAPAETSDEVRRVILDEGWSEATRAEAVAALAGSRAVTDREQAARLRMAASDASLEMRATAHLAVFFKEDGQERARLSTKALAGRLEPLLLPEARRVAALRGRLVAAEAVERTEALFTVALAIRAAIAAGKRRLGALSFSDLIDRTLALLDQDRAAAWVLYRLDRGIDHVLVDEAQDTNPKQWLILRRLTEEFTAGAGRPVRTRRTMFAVGDAKQSIYSFQGADPRWFEAGRRHWSGLVKSARLTFHDVRLDLSFRSAPAILAAVDHTFAVETHFRGLSFEDAASGTRHLSARPNAPGHIEIWPTAERGPQAPADPWAPPGDMLDQASPALAVARRVARAVRTWTRDGDETGRVWRPSDVLILSRKRGAAFFAVIRALREAEVPVAGADRLEMGEHIAVHDLVAAGSAALLPENDLNLAAALKSPLAGLDDDDLIRIAADRGEAESLAAALARLAPSDDGARRGHEALDGWRDLARRQGPFGFYARLLGPLGGRRLLIERLGGEAADAIDAFLCEAAAAEGGAEVASLTAFLARFEATTHTVKRDLAATGDEVRVMTVHGSKGLEAKVVVLLDGCDVLEADPPLLGVAAGPEEEPIPVWALGKAVDCPALAAARAGHQQAALEEHNRLLYVAMTRAADRLVIAPFAGRPGAEKKEAAWCAMVRRGFADAMAGLVRIETDWGPADIWRDDPAPVAETSVAGPAAVPPPWRPTWLDQPAPADATSLDVLSPSEVAGVEAISPPAAAAGPVPRWPGRRRDPAVPTRAAARRRGILLHDLLDRLGQVDGEAEPAALAERVLGERATDLDPEGRRALAAEVLGVVTEPRLAPLFGPASRSEVPVAGTARLPGGGERPVLGRIDRLAVTPEAVWIGEFKTGAATEEGDAPLAHLVQLALYREVMRDLYPDRPVRCLLVGTRGPTVLEPAEADLDAALACIGSGLA